MFKETNSLATGTLIQPIFFLTHTAFENAGWLCLKKQKKKGGGKLLYLQTTIQKLLYIQSDLICPPKNTYFMQINYLWKKNLHPFAKSVSGLQSAVLFSTVSSRPRTKHTKMYSA